MARILLHCPLNISRSLVQMMQECCQRLQQDYHETLDVEVQAHRPQEVPLFKGYVERGTLPDLTVGHVDDFADLDSAFVADQVQALPGRFDLRPELADLGFAHGPGWFHPFAVIPFAMFYNPTLVSPDEVPRTWGDLLDARWKGRILMPDPNRIVSAVVKTCMRSEFPESFANFPENITQQGSPPEVVTAVDEGRYPLGITNIAFARISRYKNTRIVWPEDGLFCMPQVMVFGPGASEALLAVGDYLMSRPVQEYLALQSFVPASGAVDLHPLVAEHHCHLRWKGWDAFLEMVQGRHDL